MNVYVQMVAMPIADRMQPFPPCLQQTSRDHLLATQEQNGMERKLVHRFLYHVASSYNRTPPFVGLLVPTYASVVRRLTP